MTGTISTKKDRKNWYAILNIYGDDGKRKRKWIDTGIAIDSPSAKTKAKKRLDELLVEYRKSGIDLNKDTDFLEFVAQWLESRKPHLSPVTYDGYCLNFNAHIKPFFAPKKLKVEDITPAVIQSYITKKLASGLSGNTVRRHLDNLSKCLTSAVWQNIIAFNPVGRVEKPPAKKFTGAKFYNERQIEQLLETSKGSPLEIVVLMTVFYGLRRSEVLGLKWKALDFEAKTIKIQHTVSQVGKNIHRQDRTKNDASNATLPIPDNIIARLLDWKAQQEHYKSLQPNDYIDEGYICTKANGELMLPSFISKHFPLMLRKNEMPHIRFHDLRHSSASYLKYLGFDLKDIQVWLRHKDIQTTMNLYTHLDMDAKKNIADTLGAKLQGVRMTGAS